MLPRGFTKLVAMLDVAACYLGKHEWLEEFLVSPECPQGKLFWVCLLCGKLEEQKKGEYD